MRKISIFILIVFGILITFNACNKKDTYADKLKKENKAINRFIAEKGITLIHELSKDDPITFGETTYYKDGNTGVYFHIDDYGTGDPIKEGNRVSLRYDTLNIFLVRNDTIQKGNDYYGITENLEIKYGKSNTYIDNNTSSLGYLYKSAGCVLPIKYGLKDGARVSLIIPFSSGSTLQQASYEPMYVNGLIYRIID